METILVEPFFVTPNAPIFPEYDVTPHPEPIRPAHRQPKPSTSIPLCTASFGIGGAATILAAAI